MNILNQIRQYDFNIYHYFYDLNNSSALIHYSAYFFARYGIVFFLLSFIYLTWKKKIRAFLCILLAMGVAGLVDFIVFVFWQRPRPFVTHGMVVNADFYGLDTNLSSFPSSHTYIAFAIAISIFLYGHRKLGSILFLLASAVAIGRMCVGLHYPSDIIGGAILGTLSGVMVYYMVRNWEKR